MQTVLDRENLRLTRDMESGHSRVVVTGDVDIGDVAAFTDVLARAAASADGDLHVDCHGLRTSTMEGLQAFVQVAHDLAGRDRRLVLHALSAHFVSALRLAHWDKAPGLRFE